MRSRSRLRLARRSFSSNMDSLTAAGTSEANTANAPSLAEVTATQEQAANAPSFAEVTAAAQHEFPVCDPSLAEDATKSATSCSALAPSFTEVMATHESINISNNCGPDEIPDLTLRYDGECK